MIWYNKVHFVLFIIMDKHSENSSEKKSKDSARAFGCPCGKTYLSYPALFTHVKQKHEGNVIWLQLSLQENWSNLRQGK